MTTKQTIGEKVKQLRKAKGLTQTDLAGDHMTKSMLSQIENGRALPSMNSLQVLAGRLGVDPGYFLEGEEEAELAPLVREMEAEFKAKNYSEVIRRLQPFTERTLPMTIDAARLLEFYVSSLFYTGAGGGEAELERAALIYERFGLFVERAKVQYISYALNFAQSRYAEGLELIRRVRKEYEANKVGNDFIFEIDLHYAESISLSALGDYAGSREAAQAALQVSREEGIYYMTDHLYRVLGILALTEGETLAAEEALKKARAFAEFTESQDSLKLVLIGEIRLAVAKGEYSKVLALARQYPQEDEQYAPSVQLMSGIAWYHLGQDDEALSCLTKAEPGEQVYHPLDRGNLLTAYAYRARICMRRGMKEEAQRLAGFAYDQAMEYPPSIYTEMINETYRELHN
ncbi:MULTISPECIES: helix-turn-helix domain-containing protein [unclassified Paenibacillus]|uniref:helix-turn-helix domain-containing protein n=1 Tax=unclassified Paenibacillus TaxID=185978 RepID=UPI0030F72F4B